jgi:tRNA modification GTPase
LTPPRTIFALSSGRPPAGIAVVRISGPDAGAAGDALIGCRPPERRATATELRDPGSGEVLDRALVLWLPGPGTATGEDLVELHLHGGRAVVDGVLGSLAGVPGLRAAEPGEFTRRAFENGRIDLNEAEGLADLLAAETQSQRRAAMLAAGGAVSRRVADWQARLLALSAQAEARIDYADEDDVSRAGAGNSGELTTLAAEMRRLLARPPVERLRDGVRVVLAGPPNSGKSSLLNALSGREAAIATPVPGTTRDVIEVPMSVRGVPLILIDTAGLREADDEIEMFGVRKAQKAIEGADIVLWMGDGTPPPGGAVIAVRSFSDLGTASDGRLSVSARTGENLGQLLEVIVREAEAVLPAPGEVALNRRQRDLIAALVLPIEAADWSGDPLIVADELREALRLCDALTGRAGVEQMLDALFGRFCLGK